MSRLDINALVLESKMGNRQSYEKLWDLHREYAVRNVDAIVSLYNGFDQYRDSLYNDCKLYGLYMVKEYDFNGKYSFSYFFHERMREKLISKIKGNMWLSEKLIDYDKLRSYRGYRNVYYRSQIKMMKEFTKKLTTKQLQAYQMHHYEGLDQLKIADKLGIAQKNVHKRLQQCYAKLRKNMIKVRKDERKRPRGRPRKHPVKSRRKHKAKS